MAPSSLAHPGAVDIDLAAECEKLGQLARALDLVQGPQELRQPRCALRAGDRLDVLVQLLIEIRVGKGILVVPGERPRIAMRSEEHTSELQSRLHLVCRLLLEKKKTH